MVNIDNSDSCRDENDFYQAPDFELVDLTDSIGQMAGSGGGNDGPTLS